jgi:hypothetical protein
MNKVIFYIVLTLSFKVYAKPKQALVCLGQEEFSYHQAKQTGPLYKLNQAMISEYLQFPENVSLKKVYFDKVCQNAVKSPSLALLESALRDGKKIFLVIDAKDDQKNLIAKNQIEQFIKKCNEIFLSLLRDVQAGAPNAQCLKKQIPNLDKFLLYYKYLEEDVNQKNIFEDTQVVVRFFSHLEKIKEIYQKCLDREGKEIKKSSNKK